MAKKITEKETEKEVNKRAGKVSEDDVCQTVKDEANFKKLFASVEKLQAYWDDVQWVFKMLKDYVTGKYRKVPWRTIAVLVAALAYVLAPFDLVPDFIPVIGWSDDCLALGGALAFAKMDLDEYKAWKLAQEA